MNASSLCRDKMTSGDTFRDDYQTASVMKKLTNTRRHSVILLKSENLLLKIAFDTHMVVCLHGGE